jgi:hypothetical protein
MSSSAIPQATENSEITAAGGQLGGDEVTVAQLDTRQRGQMIVNQ